MKIALLSPTNVDLIARTLSEYGHETYTAGYGQVVVEAVNANSGLYKFQPEAIIVFYDAQDVFGDHLLRPFLSDDHLTGGIADELESTVSALAQNLPSASIILNTIPMPTTNGMGRLDNHTQTGLRPRQYRHNVMVSELANRFPQALLHDYAALAESNGLETWYDNRIWYLARARHSQDAIREMASDLDLLLSTLRSPRAKVIVVDLDNTCWGGVVGDDGLDGIVLGVDGPGLAFSTFQKALLNFRDQGVLIAVASKNDMEVVHDAFDNHPGMILTRDDISSWQVNWEDKALSINRIAAELDLGSDSFVFFDDNPAERLRISETHPEVTVVDVPSDPADYVSVLFDCDSLKSLTLTSEDLVRPQQYWERAERKSSSQSFTDVRQFLESLEMKVEISEDLSVSLTRIAQLTQKTNQFNLRTKRYSEGDLTGMVTAGTHRVFWLRLQDRFGDEGIVAVAIVELGTEWFIDTLLMSCRVLNRGVEQALVRFLKQKASAAGASTLVGEYIETNRNAMVKDLYQSMDFSPADGRWVSDAASSGPEGVIELSVNDV